MRKVGKGETVYVLMELEGTPKSKVREWRPTAVVTDPGVAEQWYQYGANVDWVPLELDAVSNIGPENMPHFQPRKSTPGEERAKELADQMKATLARYQKIVQDQQALIKKLQKGQGKPTPARTAPATASLLKRNAGKPITQPPKPAGFDEYLYDARDIANYIETWATYEVDPEFVEEQFRGEYAKLQLLPIDSLIEGGRDHNLQSPANERKYQRMSIKTIPPLLVRGNEVLDGNHRLRAAKKRGLTHLWAYVVMEGRVPDGSETDTDSDS